MQYLKDNHYKVIAMRDLAEYIDPAKAARLPPTAGEFKDTGSLVLAAEEKPCGAVPPGKRHPRQQKETGCGEAHAKTARSARSRNAY